MAYTAINDPSAHFQTALYNGSSSSVTVTNDGNANLQPDWLWIKSRNSTHNHDTFNSTRGMTSKRLFPNLNNAEDSNGIASVTSDGFTTGTSIGNINTNGETYVAWQWKATAGTTATNNAGALSSTVQANTTAGFSIVKWTSDGNNGRTVGHGLGVKPTVIITKNISAVGSWYSFFEEAGVDKYLRINSADAVTTNTDIFGGGAQATSVFTIGQSAAGYSNGNAIIAYVFAPIKGYSKFGKYSGNGNANGPFIYTGFKPAFLMRKCINEGLDWVITDSARDPVNVSDENIYANLNYVEYSGSETKFDFLSNGFKMRGDWTTTNKSGNTYIYMAFAETPLVATNNVIALAR